MGLLAKSLSPNRCQCCLYSAFDFAANCPRRKDFPDESSNLSSLSCSAATDITVENQRMRKESVHGLHRNDFQVHRSSSFR